MQPQDVRADQRAALRARHREGLAAEDQTQLGDIGAGRERGDRAAEDQVVEGRPGMQRAERSRACRCGQAGSCGTSWPRAHLHLSVLESPLCTSLLGTGV